MSIRESVAEVRARIAAACADCGRNPDSVEILAVSKKKSAEHVREALAAGLTAFGENRVQELAAKAEELEGSGVRWHLVGSLQTNKVRSLLTVENLELVHSLDRARLADVLQAELARIDGGLDVLLQVNATGEEQKHGVEPGDAQDLLRHVRESCPALRPRGLMAMGPLEGDPVPVFDRVARLRDELQAGSGIELPVLSLGMTADLEPAVAAGSTLVRIGTAIFGPR